MRLKIRYALLAVSVLVSSPALAVTVPTSSNTPPAATPAPAASRSAAAAPAAPAEKPFYSSNSTLNVLLTNPDTAAVFAKDLPNVPMSTDAILSQVGAMSPRQVAFMAPLILTDAALKKLDDDLAKIPAPKADGPAAAPGAAPPEGAKPADPVRPMSPPAGPSAAPAAAAAVQ